MVWHLFSHPTQRRIKNGDLSKSKTILKDMLRSVFIINLQKSHWISHETHQKSQLEFLIKLYLQLTKTGRQRGKISMNDGLNGKIIYEWGIFGFSGTKRYQVPPGNSAVPWCLTSRPTWGTAAMAGCSSDSDGTVVATGDPSTCAVTLYAGPGRGDFGCGKNPTIFGSSHLVSGV